MAKEKQKKIVAPRLPREVITALVNIVGEEWVSEDRAIVETYSRFSVDITIIDMALGRQDCCSYYYGGVIY